ncbi:U7 snRNA-associated Sm-like protein LSm10 [Contarinia nasturtii]|uniref:U7 snRNA-associated Sm-like protein LSm10 n=1 Tax=Contarinia nasturtii TaxID=265458 RepID=UPI0012D49774|nr:U7 snRNA-associated Sm-like protein LSm10 [Contarinia nasturtii]
MDSRNYTKLECSKLYNSLSCIPLILKDKNTIIDLWNDTTVAGTIHDVDGFMNITMINVVFIDQQGKMRPLDNFFVLARNVKYIHIPNEVDVTQALEKLFNKKPRDMKDKQPQKSFKLKRAQKYQLETLRELAAQQENQESDEASQGTSSENTA